MGTCNQFIRANHPMQPDNKCLTPNWDLRFFKAIKNLLNREASLTGFEALENKLFDLIRLSGPSLYKPRL